MLTNFAMCKRLDKEFTPKNRGILDGDEVVKISTILSLDQRENIIDLRNLRDFVVMFFGQKADSDQKNEIAILDKVSGITAVIDQRIFGLGGEV